MVFLNIMLSVKVKVGKRRTIVIPRVIAEKLKLEEGSIVKLSLEGDKIIIEPLYDAVWLSLYGRKIARITLKELEEESIERQN